MSYIKNYIQTTLNERYELLSKYGFQPNDIICLKNKETNKIDKYKIDKNYCLKSVDSNRENSSFIFKQRQILKILENGEVL